MDDSSDEAWLEHCFRHYQDSPLPETLEEAERLAASIEQAVSRETGRRVHNLHVEVTGGVVTLRGRCATYYTKQQAQHAAMTFRQSGPLDNQIEVT
jgi:osmotically-inducible protein OsmY